MFRRSCLNQIVRRIQMSSLLKFLLLYSVFVTGVLSQEESDPTPDPCADLKKQLEELQRQIEENNKKLDEIIKRLEENANPDENPVKEPPGGSPGGEQDGGNEGGDETVENKLTDNPVKDSLTDEEWKALMKKLKEEAAQAVKDLLDWLGPGGAQFWGCIDPDARQVLIELMLYLGPKEFARQFDKLKGVNYKTAARIIRNSAWGRRNPKKADALAKHLEAIKGPINPPDKRMEVLDLDECWTEGGFKLRPGFNRFKNLFKIFRRPSFNRK